MYDAERNQTKFVIPLSNDKAFAGTSVSLIL